ncbi:MAG: fibronectin type III domain-containing protein, partial [Planctomycetota bacterium]
MQEVGSGASPRYTGNTLESNDMSLVLGGTDGINVEDGNCTSNTIVRSADGANRPYKSMRAGYWTGMVQDVRIIDPSYAGGATDTIVWEGSGLKDLSLGWLFSVHVRDAAGNPVPSATVTLTDKDGAQVASAATDASGNVNDVHVITAIHRQLTTNPANIATDTRTPHTLTVSATGYTTYMQPLTLTQSQTLTINLSTDTTPPTLSNITATGVTLTTATITWQTDEPANSFIQYGTGTLYGNSLLNTTFTTSHSLTLTDLIPGTLYHYRVTSADALGNSAMSEDFTFTTQGEGGTALPRLPETFETPFVLPQGGATFNVNQGDNLQAVIDQAQLGDVIVLQAGATFTGNFKLPNKSGSGWLYIISSDLANLPEGKRVGPADAAHMPKIVPPIIHGTSDTSQAAIFTDFGAHHYRLAGLDISSPTSNYNLVLMGYGLNNYSDPLTSKIVATTVGQLPHHITVDRSYLHSTNVAPPWVRSRYGIGADGKYVAVVDSYLSNFHDSQDSQAILIWNGEGPYKFVNNYLEATGENFMSGGNDPRIPNAVPSDIEFRGNYLYKPIEWKAISEEGAPSLHIVKNLFELKNAQRVLVEGNVFEHSWPNAQTGRAIVLKACNQEGTADWSRSWDITFRKNIIRRAAGGISLVGDEHISGGTTDGMKRVLIEDNLADLTDAADWVGTLFMMSLGSSADMAGDSVTITNNTMIGKTSATALMQIGSTDPDAFGNVVIANNIWRRGAYGIKGTGTAEGTASLDFHLGSYTYGKNLLIDYTGSSYPAGNFQVAGIADVGFTDATFDAAADFALSGSSVYKNQGTDGEDLGADISALLVATSCTESGDCTGADTTPPVLSQITVSDVSQTSATVTWTTDEPA